MLWVLNLSDGQHDLLDVAERAKIPFRQIKHAANALLRVGCSRPSRRRTASPAQMATSRSAHPPARPAAPWSGTSLAIRTLGL